MSKLTSSEVSVQSWADECDAREEPSQQGRWPQSWELFPKQRNFRRQKGCCPESFWVWQLCLLYIKFISPCVSRELSKGIYEEKPPFQSTPFHRDHSENLSRSRVLIIPIHLQSWERGFRILQILWKGVTCACLALARCLTRLSRWPCPPSAGQGRYCDRLLGRRLLDRDNSKIILARAMKKITLDCQESSNQFHCLQRSAFNDTLLGCCI